ncbi:seryl-tRNA synthetase [Gregarina niphandrodes]|uniref:serine--tRNA ligase n=1 Tax=Gregarina niphandrodes TaxID=110365 RepID=A0A023B5F1_GRENI|nr:seryl-tRNA synthetase [Gregarina niphandrodes]EZG60246.1 seryl-tRNA synthetase [Gregarina niphandrodes]|eukprot:XP_011130849.1 seryl-tRNA synthetase [Gregarina niphandrodes]
MLDINLLREDRGGNPEVVRESEKRRGRSGSIVDKVLSLDGAWVKAQFAVDCAKRDANGAAKRIGIKKKEGACEEELVSIMAEAAELKKKIPEAEAAASKLLSERDTLMHRIGNVVHESVPTSNDEANNAVLRTWGELPKPVLARKAHHEILEALDGFDMKKANDVAGHRAYYLKGYGAMLNQALFQYGQSFLRKKGYTTIQTPYFMKRDFMTLAAELSDFNETLYKIPATTATADVKACDGKDVSGGKDVKACDSKVSDKESGEDLFLIATSEQPLCCLHANDYVEPRDVPIRYCGISTCFRKEAGSHGKDMRGIFRVHQFEKVEQFVVCDPKDSWAMQEEMIAASEEFYQTLNLPYRVVAIVSGALNDAAARKYDLEAWFPSYDDYRELVSCSNCTDYQARDLSIRLGAPKMNEREKTYVHLLNGTLCATERTMCCLIEHWQTEDGVTVPPPLIPYMDGLTFLPYKKK